MKFGRKNIIEWQKLLQITGGDLSLEKCKVSIMKWHQRGEWGRIELATKRSNPGTVSVTSVIIFNFFEPSISSLSIFLFSNKVFGNSIQNSFKSFELSKKK